jgi:hypothetical protein
MFQNKLNSFGFFWVSLFLVGEHDWGKRKSAVLVKLVKPISAYSFATLLWA